MITPILKLLKPLMILKIRANKTYSFIDNVIEQDAIIDLPESYRQLLISGALFSLTSRPKYKDKDLFASSDNTLAKIILTILVVIEGYKVYHKREFGMMDKIRFPYLINR